MKKKIIGLCACLCAAVLATGCAKDNAQKAKSYEQYITLGEYKGLTITGASSEVTEDKIDAYINSALEANGSMETLEVTDRPVAAGDLVDIDFEGLLDGVAFEGGTAEHYQITIGSGSFIDGFEEGLIGVSPGEEVSLPLAFPDPYSNNPDLAGKEVIFNVKVNSIVETVYSELTDELVQSFTESTTVSEYVASVKELLETEAAETAKNEDISALVKLAVANTEIKEYPQEELDAEKANFVEYYTSYAAYYSVELSEFITGYLGIAEEEFYNYAEETSTNFVGERMVLSTIANKENIKVTDEDYEKVAKANYFTDKAEMIAEIGEEEAFRNVMISVAKEYLYKNAVIQ